MIKKWRKKILVTGLILLVMVVAVGYYATQIEPYRLVVHEETLQLPHWNKELNGFKIVAVSDIHGDGGVTNEARLHQIVEVINSQNPDIIVLLGDYVSEVGEAHSQNLRMPIETVAENLKGLKARFGIYAAIGNHDWWYDEKKVRGAFENVGFKVLDNELASFQVRDKTVWIVGIEDFWKRRRVRIDDLLALKIDKPENILAITHNPDSFEFTSDKISLVMAGHTHGGQVRFPIIGPPLAVAKRKYTLGHVEENGRNLFVTTGVGVMGLSIRFGVPPEIVVLTVNGKD